MKVVVLNGQKVNYDGLIDYQSIGGEVTVYADSAPGEIPGRVQGAEAVITKELVLTPEQVLAFPDSVRLIVEAGTGYNNIPLAAAKEKGITVCNVPAYSTDRVAHTAVLLMLMLASRMDLQAAMLAKGDRSNFTEHLKVPHTELNGKTLGVIGAGTIGRAVMKIAVAMGMKVLAYNRSPREDGEGVHYTTLEEVLGSCDYLSLHCPLTDSTRHLINRDTIALMKKSACIINTARGALIDEPELIKALKDGRIAAAGLDVQETEPPAADSPLYTMDNVIITPHMGWKGLETRQRLLEVVKNDVRAFEEGNPINVVG